MVTILRPGSVPLYNLCLMSNVYSLYVIQHFLCVILFLDGYIQTELLDLAQSCIKSLVMSYYPLSGGYIEVN